MTLVLYLNELSAAPTFTTRHEAEAALVEMSQTLVKIHEVRSDLALCTPLPLNQIQLASNYYLGQWASDPRYRDHFRKIQATLNHAPFVLPDADSSIVEYWFENELCLGLGLAHVAGTSTLSLSRSDIWRSLTLAVTREAVLEDGAMEHEDVIIQNFSNSASVANYRTWLQQYGFSVRLSGAEIWARRLELFPSMLFLDRVGSDLTNLTEDRIDAVRERLAEMNEAVSKWNPATRNSPQWRSKITPEFEGRRRFCWFDDTDGTSRCFDLHARFTPRAGRIHFRLVPSQATLTIAYIGDKL